MTALGQERHLFEGRRQAEAARIAAAARRGRSVIQAEADGLNLLTQALDSTFEDAIAALLKVTRRIIVSGMGKSGHIARKIAATLASTGTPAYFIHPAEAAHGDLGMMISGDALLALSNSGSTPELGPLISHAQRLQCPIIAIASEVSSPLMRAATVCLRLPQVEEACPAKLAPTTSTTMMLALGDALAVGVMTARGFSRENMLVLHPGGTIGSRAKAARDIMHHSDALPLVIAATPMADVIVEMTGKSLGIAGVVDDLGMLIGVITDGDLRRHSRHLFELRAAAVMSPTPKTILAGAPIEQAMQLMQEYQITAVFVMDDLTGKVPVGIVHVHDIARLAQF